MLSYRLCVEADSSGEHEVHLEEQPADEEQIEKDAKTQVSLVTEKSIFDGPCSKITSKSEPIDGADVHMKTPNMKMTQNPLTLNEPQNVSHVSN